MARPEHLPDFLKPPLHEVVLGVQFNPPEAYQQILAGEVRNLFRADYPGIQEKPALVPTFETFGLPFATSQLHLLSGAQHDRFWFLTADECELIQFQQDRLLHNWRKRGAGSRPYPRFESMVERFQDEIDRLERYCSTLAPQALQITQCEITYVNHIRSLPNKPLAVEDWLRLLSFPTPVRADDFSLAFREVISDETGSPRGRLAVELLTAINEERVPMITMNLTVRGAPREQTVRSALEFISKGRELIVDRFAQLTTDPAHKHWERVT